MIYSDGAGASLLKLLMKLDTFLWKWYYAMDEANYLFLENHTTLI
jgi:hypothetical protein